MIVMHTADLHLGAAPDRAYPWGQTRKAALKRTFVRLIDEAEKIRPDLLLIAGDLFHGQPSLAELQEVNAQFSRIPDTIVALCAGNHDCIRENSRYPSFPFAENVIGFWEERLTSVPVPEKDCRLYGLSYHSLTAEHNLYAGARAEGPETFHILLLHGGDERHSPVDREELRGAGFDYIALGHIHRPGILLPHLAAWPGSLEPLDRTETGPRGYLLCTLEKDRPCDIRFVPFSEAVYGEMTLEVPENCSLYTLQELVREEAQALGPDNIYTLRLTGDHACGFPLRPEDLAEAANILEIRDETLSADYLEKLCRQNPGGILDRFIHAARKLPGPEGEIALKEGIAALLAAAEKRH